MKNKIFLILIMLHVFQCSKTNLQKINQWLEKDEFERILEFANINQSKLSDEELYLSSQAVSKLQNFLRKNRMEKKYSDSKYFTNLGKKIGVKINWIQTESGKQILLEDKYLNLIKESNYYKNKAVLDKYIFCAKTNEIYENSFLLTDILDMDPRLHISEFKIIWIESLKLALPSNLGESGREKFYQILHYLASKEETDLKNIFYQTEGTNVNLRSGPGTENANVGKLNKETVIQIDTDYNTTTIGGKTGKWIQIYVWNTDTVGWIFSPFLKEVKLDYSIGKLYEKTLVEQTNFTKIDFSEWNPDEIPNGFYGNYTKTKKVILDGNIGFTLYPLELERGICTKIKKKSKKFDVSFQNENTNDRIMLFYLKLISNSNSKTISKVEIWKNQIFLNSKPTGVNLEENKTQNITFNFGSTDESQILFSIVSNLSSNEIFQNETISIKDIDGWELCIPQGKSSSSRLHLFSFSIY